MQLPWDFCLIMPEPMAIMMAYLINFARRCRAEQTGKGWFWCTVKSMEKQLRHLNRDAQHHRLKFLKENLFIDMEKRGNPPKRYIYINYDRLDEALSRYQKEIEEMDFDDMDMTQEED